MTAFVGGFNGSAQHQRQISLLVIWLHELSGPFVNGLEIYVADTGIGMTKAELEKAFLPHNGT
jgi:signal transduction histidine kinase